MRKFILAAMILVPGFMMAQSEWELPKQKQEVKDTKAKTEAPAEAKKKNSTIEPKYAAGTVPEVNGNVEWKKTIQCPGKSASQLYDQMLKIMEEKTHAEGQIDSKISAVNPKEHVIAGKYVEDMVFSNGFLARDFTHARYTLIATCKDGSVELCMCRISYKYNVGRNNETTYMAEEWITDKEAINKKGTKLYAGNGKFRRKTIDRKDELFAEYEAKLK